MHAQLYNPLGPTRRGPGGIQSHSAVDVKAFYNRLCSTHKEYKNLASGPVSALQSSDAIECIANETSPGPVKEVLPSTPTLNEVPCISTRATYTISARNKQTNYKKN